MSIRIIALTLAPTDAQRAAFLRLRRAFADACNHISRVAWDTGTFNRVRLQTLVYQDVRATYGLMAQHTCQAVSIVAQTYRADKDTKRAFKPTMAVTLDTPRLYRITGNHVAITTLDGRSAVKLNIGGIQRAWLKGATALKEADLVCDRKGRWRLMVSAVYADPPPMDTNGVIGVDLGRTDIAMTSDGDTFSGQQVTTVRDRYSRTRRMIQRHVSKGTRSSRRRGRQTLAWLSGREHRFQAQVNHTISRRIVTWAVESERAIALEDLTGMRERTTRQARTKTERRRSNSWAFHQLRLFLAYKCVGEGVPLVRVNPAYTSQICHCCVRRVGGEDRVRRKPSRLMDHLVRTPLTPDFVSESSKEQGNHSMWGRSRIGESLTPRAISARCAWRELYCPNSSLPVFWHTPSEGGYHTTGPRHGNPKAAGVANHQPWRTFNQKAQKTNGAPTHIVPRFAVNAGSPTQGQHVPAWRQNFHITQSHAVMDMAEGKSATGAHMPYRRRYKAPVTGTENPNAWEEGEYLTSHHDNRKRWVC